MKPRAITAEEKSEIRRLISYDPETGALFNKVDRGRSQRYKAGSMIVKAPNKTHGYTTIQINGRSYLTHRIAWLLMTGEWPETIDHIDHDISNNKFSNLRAVSQQENMRNVSLFKSNKTGVAGICMAGRRKDKWRVTVNHSGSQHYLGEFDSFEEALAVREKAMMQQGYHVNHGKPSIEANHV